MEKMVTIYNSLDAATPVKKFKDRATAHRRLQEALGRIGHLAGTSGEAGAGQNDAEQTDEHADAQHTDAEEPVIVDEVEQPAEPAAEEPAADEPIVAEPSGLSTWPRSLPIGAARSGRR
jgi:hypothetical protein